jgi:hypothetical protein
MNLDTIARKYKSDKCFRGGGSHNYTPFYDMILKGKDIKTMLEIGVYEGESLKMWREYLPKTVIYGWDIVPGESDDFKLFTIDQGKEDDIYRFFEFNPVNFDFVIDDGSHKYEDQIVSLFNIWPHLNAGGVYIIEDMWHDLFDCFLKRDFKNQYIMQIYDRIIEIAGEEKVTEMLETLVCVQKNNVVFSSSDDKTDHIFYTFYK